MQYLIRSSQLPCEQVHYHSQFTDWKLRLKGEITPLKSTLVKPKFDLCLGAHALHHYTNKVKPDRNSSLVAIVTEAKQLLPKLNSETTRRPGASPTLPCVCKNRDIEMGWCHSNLPSCLNNL